MITEKLCKIQSAEFVFGGYDDAMFGFNFVIGTKDWSVQDFKSLGWVSHTFALDNEKTQAVCVLREIKDLMLKSKVKSFDSLSGTPAIAFFDGQKLTHWNILEEVL